MVPADMPLIAALDVDAVLNAIGVAAVVIVPDRAAEGTNALVLTPPTALEPSFGEASFARHIHLAHEAGLRVCAVERDRLELDLDTPADVAELLDRRDDGRVSTLLRELYVERRLQRFEPAQARSTTI
jgi:2-phospho-L-lactate guanylyltransferase